MNSVKVSQQNGVLVLQLVEIDLDRQPVTPLGEELRSIVDRSPVSNILVDLVNVSFMPSAFIGQLILLKKRCDNNRLNLKLCNITPRNYEVLKLVRFDDLVQIVIDKQEALASFQSGIPDSARGDLVDGSVEYFIAKANAGEANAQYLLGLCLETGQGIEQSIAKSLEWMAKAAKQGHSLAQYKLGMSHAFGVGLPQNFSEALIWYQRAAEQGLSDAQYMMGMSLQHGLGGPQNLEQSIRWYQRAADHGRIEASLKEGLTLGVASTPSFVIAGRMYRGALSSDSISAIVRRAAADSTR